MNNVPLDTDKSRWFESCRCPRQLHCIIQCNRYIVVHLKNGDYAHAQTVCTADPDIDIS